METTHFDEGLGGPATVPATVSSHPDGVQRAVVPTFVFRKASALEDAADDCERDSLVGRGEDDRMCLNVFSVDVCRICQCGPNTLATPTPLLLTPITSPKKRLESEPGTSLSGVTIELKRPYHSPPSSPPSMPSPPAHLPSSSSPKKGKELTPDYNLISPCVCSGSLKYVHQYCLQNWIRASNNTACELCKHPFHLRSKFKPLWKWESLPIGPGEKKRIVCSALFHTVALACVVWSLYVLIDRTIEELSHTDLEWQFWTKIIVEAIGCLGAGILTYVWGKSYVSLLIRWVTFNRSFVIIGKDVTPPVEQLITTSSANNAPRQQQELINLIN